MCVDGWVQVGQRACEVVTATSNIIPFSVMAMVSIWRGAWGGKRSVQRSVHVMRVLPAGAGSRVKTSASMEKTACHDTNGDKGQRTVLRKVAKSHKNCHIPPNYVVEDA